MRWLSLRVNVIIFDFDGTIADSFETVYTIATRLSREFGYPPEPLSIAQLKDLSSREIVQLVNVPRYRLPFILRRLRRELNQQINTLEPIVGIPETLQQLHQQGYRLGIVTSNSKANVVTFLVTHQLDQVFDFVESGLTLFGKGKILRRVISHLPRSTTSAIYVGDETRDIEAARSIGIPIVAVTWGYNSAVALSAYQPDYLIEAPAQLLEVATAIQASPPAFKPSLR